MPRDSCANHDRLARLGSLLADASRAAILVELLDGSARPAGELAARAGIAPATASVHLRRLCEGGLLQVIAQGRHRYYRIAGEDAAHAIESILSLGNAVSARSAAVVAPDAALAHARTCYRHVAGRIGVALFDVLFREDSARVDADALRLGTRGLSLLQQAGLMQDASAFAQLPGRMCLDWTQRRWHLAGALGARLAQALFDADWLRRRRGTRALLVTARGAAGMRALGIDEA